MKGALVGFMPAFGVSMPNVVAFQFNPETLRHSWSQPQSGKPGSDPLGVSGMPGETFSFSLAMDATDQLALPQADPRGDDARSNGIYSRIAALEMMMFPLEPAARTGGAAPARGKRAVPAALLRMALFVWGANRIVPVRVTSLTITEKLFDASLNPTHAEAQIELRVLTSTDLASFSGELQRVAAGAYRYSQGNRTRLAAHNLGASAELIDLIPMA